MSATTLPVGTLPRTSTGLVAAIAAALAGALHLAVVPAHLDGPALVPAFFLLVGVVQLCLAVGLVAHELRVLPLMGIVGAHVALIALYVASRTVDLPFVTPHHHGSHAGPEAAPGAVGNGVPIYPGARIEPVGVVDLVCVGAEVVLVVALLARIPARWRRSTLDVLAVVAVVAICARLVA